MKWTNKVIVYKRYRPILSNRAVDGSIIQLFSALSWLASHNEVLSMRRFCLFLCFSGFVTLAVGSGACSSEPEPASNVPIRSALAQDAPGATSDAGSASVLGSPSPAGVTATGRTASAGLPEPGPPGDRAISPPGIRASAIEPSQTHRSGIAQSVSEPNRAIHVEQKPLQKATRNLVSRPDTVTAQRLAKQNEYLRQWEALRPSLANLPTDQQEQRQAALKNATLGN